MFKKKIALILILVAIVFMSFGCANEPEKTEEETGAVSSNVDKGDSNKNPIVTIEMADGGVIKVELYPDVAPNTVNNFIALVDSGYYDGTIFHRVIPGFMIQGGSSDGTGMGGPDYSIEGEFTKNGFENNLKHTRGVISMARTDHPDSASSQFFIMVDKASHLDGGYASFGTVIEGMDVVDEIISVATGPSDKPIEEQVIERMTVDKKGIEYAEPSKV